MKLLSLIKVSGKQPVQVPELFPLGFLNEEIKNGTN